MSLENELTAIAADPQRLTCAEIAALCASVSSTWHKVSFSNADDHRLARYYNFHLKEITRLSDIHLGSPSLTDALNGLADELWNNYATHLDAGLLMARAYSLHRYNRCGEQLEHIRKKLTMQISDPELLRCLTDYLALFCDPSINSRFTFRSAFYFSTMLDELDNLAPGPGFEIDLSSMLCRMNFNHLNYFAFCQQKLAAATKHLAGKKRLIYLEQELSHLTIIPEHRHHQYHPDWPSLKTMLTAYVREEINRVQKKIVPEHPEMPAKLPMNLSVAQLALLVRLLYKEQFFGTGNLSEIFRFICSHFSSKQQENISPGSFSKEFYGAGMVTAAVLRGKLSAMVTRINEDFFRV